MKHLFDKVSVAASRYTTHTYSTSFSLGIKCLSRGLQDPIYSIYGFVRLADEIVDSFHDYDKPALLAEFRKDTFTAIERRISVNPILNSFQQVVHEYGIAIEHIERFLNSMAMDLSRSQHSRDSYDDYILGSAESVGLMCLHVFVMGDKETFEKLRPYAMRLGAAFQKVNFLRDANADTELLGRSYFPGVDVKRLSEKEKKTIEMEIEADFAAAVKGIRLLPPEARFGVYLAYKYYMHLFKRIRSAAAQQLMKKRIRVPDVQKIGLMCRCMIENRLNMI